MRNIVLRSPLLWQRNALHFSGISSRRFFGGKNVDIEKEQFLYGPNLDSKKSFQDIEISEALVYALRANQKSSPTQIQAAAFHPIFDGKDVVIGAETGSGKTLAYFLPIFQRMLNGLIPRDSPKYPAIYILVPSKELCQQTFQMAQSVLKNLQHVSTEAVPSCAPVTLADGNWPYKGKGECSPDIIICTPAFLGSYLRGPHIMDPDLFSSIRTLVLDEADMLLEGSYKKDIEKVLAALKVTRRHKIRDGLLKVHERYVQFILSAATIPTHGKLSVEKYIESHFPKAISVRNAHFHKHHPRIAQTFVEFPETEMKDDDEEELVDSPHLVNAIIAALRSHNSSTNQSDNVTVMPLSEFPPIASELSEKGTPTEQVSEPTMIFVNTAENAQLLASALRQRNIPCEEFHKLVHHAVKVEGFRKFSEGITSVLVCTDVAARGLDLPFVKHVIQAEFALNVIQHLHRIGRASRAGTLGRATNFVDHHSKELVASILSEQSEESLNHSFSRRRGFRRNLKRKSAREGGAEGAEGAREEVTPE